MEIKQSQDRNLKNSQNFLHNAQLVAQLVHMSNINKLDLVYEIGFGKGIITNALTGHCKKLISTEVDPNLYNNLKKQYEHNNDIILLNQDFLTLELPHEPYKLFSNIPFDLTGEILTKLLTSSNPPLDIYFVMQYEAVLKYGGQPFCVDGLKSLMFKPIFTVDILYEFAPTDFIPKPNVTIVFAHFHQKEVCDINNLLISDWWDFLSYIYSSAGQTFKQKTKNIFSYEQQKKLRKNLNINQKAIISEWTYQQWLGLFEVYQKMVAKEKKSLVKDAYQRLLTEQSKIEKLHRNRKRG